jgi:hypothetical protein
MLSSQGHLDVLATREDGELVVASIEEQYDRARQYMERCPDHFAPRQLQMLQVSHRQ